MHAAILRYIDQVARLGSIRRAASVLNVASSAVNRQILNLEEQIGTPLFERIGNGVRPTPAGEYVIRHARQTLTAWQSVRAEISALTGDIRGEVRVLSIPAPLIRLLPSAIEAVSRAHPHITFRVTDGAPNENNEEMKAERPDIALLFVDRRYRGYDVAARIKLRLGAIMRPDHPLATKSEVTLTECAAYPVAMLSDPWLLNAAAEAEFTHSGAQFRAVTLTNSLPLTREVIRTGLGIGFFTPTGFVDELKRGELVHIPLAEPHLSASEVGLLVHRGRRLSPAVNVLTKQLVEEFNGLEREISGLTALRPLSGR